MSHYLQHNCVPVKKGKDLSKLMQLFCWQFFRNFSDEKHRRIRKREKISTREARRGASAQEATRGASAIERQKEKHQHKRQE